MDLGNNGQAGAEFRYSIRLDLDRAENLSFTDPATPFGLMRFRLIFDGSLSSDSRDAKNHRVAEKWAIRNQLHSQIEELHRVHPVLKDQQHVDVVRRLSAEQMTNPQSVKGYLEAIREPCPIEGYNFLPLVRDSLYLTCSLDVTFLRRQISSLINTKGDIDNRVKTLLDGLSMPKPGGGIVGNDPLKRPREDPCYILLEDDALITGLSVNVDRYLGGPALPEDAVLLLIEVNVRVTQLHWNNIGFLGD
jgi:hypothetical protein